MILSIYLVFLFFHPSKFIFLPYYNNGVGALFKKDVIIFVRKKGEGGGVWGGGGGVWGGGGRGGEGGGLEDTTSVCKLWFG